MLNSLRPSVDRAPKVLTAAVVTVTLTAGGLVVLAPAAADGLTAKCGLVNCDDDNGAEGSAEDGYVSIHVWGSGTTAGEGGYEIPGGDVYKLPPCHYRQGSNGKEAYENYRNWVNNPNVPEEDKITETDFEKYKDDEEGHWWFGRCNSGLFEGNIREFFDYSNEWFENNSSVYVFPGDPLPIPEIPPEVLVEYAYEAMELPEPEVDWNPKRQGDGATLVNFETWFWLDDGPVQLEVHAEAGNNSATVAATLGQMGFTAPRADPVTCDGFGMAWEPDSQSDCFLRFTQSSASLPGQVTPVFAQSHWDIEWFANGDPQGALDPQTTEQEFQVPVAESQARVID